MNETWYSVRCLFRHEKRHDMTKNYLYEERITIWKTVSFDKAIELAEKEAVEYAADTDSKYIGLSQAFELFEGNIENGSEVFSLMREHNYTSNKYLDRYFDTGYERQQPYME